MYFINLNLIFFGFMNKNFLISLAFSCKRISILSLNEEIYLFILSDTQRLRKKEEEKNRNIIKELVCGEVEARFIIGR